MTPVVVGDVSIGGGAPLCVISGPDVLEGLDAAMHIAEGVKAICDGLGLGYVFKASYDKGNRGLASSYRGPMLEPGLEMLAAVRERVGCPVLTDVHSEEEAARAGEAGGKQQHFFVVVYRNERLIIRVCAGAPRPSSSAGGRRRMY